jgi:hypothetical protein
MLGILIYAILNAVTAYVITNVLTQPDMILEPLYKVLMKLPNWLHKPLISCSYCFGGQLALWTFFVLFDYNFLNHIYFISLTIFIITLINKLHYGTS